MEEKCSIIMEDGLCNGAYVREITFRGNKEVVVMPATSLTDIATFDKELAENIVNFLNLDTEKSKLKFRVEV